MCVHRFAEARRHAAWVGRPDWLRSLLHSSELSSLRLSPPYFFPGPPAGASEWGVFWHENCAPLYTPPTNPLNHCSLFCPSAGASEWEVFWNVTVPNIKWGLLYGIILTNAVSQPRLGA